MCAIPNIVTMTIQTCQSYHSHYNRHLWLSHPLIHHYMNLKQKITLPLTELRFYIPFNTK